MPRPLRNSLVTFMAITAASVTFASQTTSYHFRSIVHPSIISTKMSADNKLLGIDISRLLYDKYVFALRDAKTQMLSYTRSGNFFMMDGYFYQQGKRLQGYSLSTELLAKSGELVDIEYVAQSSAKATTQVHPVINLNASAGNSARPFHADNPYSYEYVANHLVYDSLGQVYEGHIYFAKDAVNSWSVYVVVDGSTRAVGQLAFSPSGVLNRVDGLSDVLFYPKDGATMPQSLAYEFKGTTQYASQTQIMSITYDGLRNGYLESVDIDDIGYVNLGYTNGETITAGKIAVMRAPN